MILAFFLGLILAPLIVAAIIVFSPIDEPSFDEADDH